MNDALEMRNAKQSPYSQRNMPTATSRRNLSLCVTISFLRLNFFSVLWIELWLSCLERNYLKCFYLLNKPKLRKCFFSCIMFVLAHREYFADLLCIGTDIPSGAPDDLYDIFVLCSSLIWFPQHLYKERDWFKIITILKSFRAGFLQSCSNTSTIRSDIRRAYDFYSYWVYINKQRSCLEW